MISKRFALTIGDAVLPTASIATPLDRSPRHRSKGSVAIGMTEKSYLMIPY